MDQKLQTCTWWGADGRSCICSSERLADAMAAKLESMTSYQKTNSVNRCIFMLRICCFAGDINNCVFVDFKMAVAILAKLKNNPVKFPVFFIKKVVPPNKNNNNKMNSDMGSVPDRKIYHNHNQ